MKIRTEFTEMLGIDYPIVGAPMFLVSYEEYAIAVSEAGALGAVGAIVLAAANRRLSLTSLRETALETMLKP